MDVAILKVIEDLIYSLEKEVRHNREKGSDSEETEDYEDSYDWLFTRKYESLSYIAFQYSFVVHVSTVKLRTTSKNGWPKTETISKQSLLNLMTLKLPMDEIEDVRFQEPNRYRPPSRHQAQKKYKFLNYKYPGSKKTDWANHTVIPLPRDKIIFNSPEFDRHMLAKKKHAAKDPINGSFTERNAPLDNIMLEFTPDKPIGGKGRRAINLKPFNMDKQLSPRIKMLQHR